ncbi:MAG: sulfatase-like hydrolase/transferase [Planctomycetes bacterium]|nr:sulfatase-like hydrolase/transferase [Planctomycetota bacterium]
MMHLRPTACALAALLCCACSRPAEEEAPAPAQHLLLISVDALRADRLGCYGGRAEASPTIDRLAREGVLFERAFAPMGQTLSSLTSLLTSRYPDETGVLDNTMVVNPEEETLAEVLAAAGFRCQGLVANGVLRPGSSGIDQGFEFFRRIEVEEQLTGKARKILAEEFGRGRRDFLWLHYMDPHQPYDARAPYAEQFDPDYQGNLDTSPETLDRIYVDRVELAPDDLEHIKAVYDSQVRRVDDMIGAVLGALDKSAAAEETLVVFTADHGEELYDRNYFFYHANSLYGSVTGVPLIFRWPRELPAGRRVDSLVELVDVMPTALALLGLDSPAAAGAAGRRGIDLRPALQGETLRKDFAFAQVRNKAYAVRNKEWLLVLNPLRFRPRSVPREGQYVIGERELFRLADDPQEQANVIDRYPEIEARMGRVLQEWRESLRQGRMTQQELSEEELKEMERLGYLGK